MRGTPFADRCRRDSVARSSHGIRRTWTILLYLPSHIDSREGFAAVLASLVRKRIRRAIVANESVAVPSGVPAISAGFCVSPGRSSGRAFSGASAIAELIRAKSKRPSSREDSPARSRKRPFVRLPRASQFCAVCPGSRGQTIRPVPAPRFTIRERGRPPLVARSDFFPDESERRAARPWTSSLRSPRRELDFTGTSRIIVLRWDPRKEASHSELALLSHHHALPVHSFVAFRKVSDNFWEENKRLSLS